MREIRERLARFENEFWLYVGCALDRNRNVNMALVSTWRKLLAAKSEAEIAGNEDRASNALDECKGAFGAARIAWGI